MEQRVVKQMNEVSSENLLLGERDVILEVLYYLPPKELLATQQVCKDWYKKKIPLALSVYPIAQLSQGYLSYKIREYGDDIIIKHCVEPLVKQEYNQNVMMQGGGLGFDRRYLRFDESLPPKLTNEVFAYNINRLNADTMRRAVFHPNEGNTNIIRNIHGNITHIIKTNDQTREKTFFILEDTKRPLALEHKRLTIERPAEDLFSFRNIVNFINTEISEDLVIFTFSLAYCYFVCKFISDSINLTKDYGDTDDWGINHWTNKCWIDSEFSNEDFFESDSANDEYNVAGQDMVVLAG